MLRSLLLHLNRGDDTQHMLVQGWIDRGTGEVQLDFIARFYFTAPLYKVTLQHRQIVSYR